MAAFASRPGNAWYALKGLGLVASRQRRVPDARKYFVTWVYGWTNFVSQNSGLSADDFNIDSYSEPLVREAVLPDGYAEAVREDIPLAKTKAQRNATVQQLERLVARRALPLAQVR